MAAVLEQNDGRFPDESDVLVRYPLNKEQEQDDKAVWPWLPGVIEQQCGPDEWLVTVYDRDLAELEDGSPAPDGTPGEDLFFPQCFRDSSELKRVPESDGHA